MKRLLFPVVLLVALALAGTWWWQTRATPASGWQGYVDADYIRVGPSQSGTLATLSVHRGDSVKTGAKLFDQDDTDECAARDQAAAALAEAKDRLTNLQKAGRDTEIAQAQADLADTRATRDRIATDLVRNRQLQRSGAVTQQAVQQQTAELTSANAHVQAAEAKLQQIQSTTGRQYEIAAQRAVVAQQQAALAQAQWRLDQRHVAAPMAARVSETFAQPGEMLQAGGPVVELLPPGNILVRFFVAQPELPRMRVGERVAIDCDNCAKDLTGTITFIAPQPEYTPPVIYSESTRDKLVYLIEAHPEPAQATMLHPGQPVTVRLVP